LPEKTIVDRLIAGLVGGVLGALAAFLMFVGLGYFVLDAELSLLGLAVAAGALVGFILSFWLGDPGVRALLRILGGGRGSLR
jgi:hypothetical protein